MAAIIDNSSVTLRQAQGDRLWTQSDAGGGLRLTDMKSFTSFRMTKRGVSMVNKMARLILSFAASLLIVSSVPASAAASAVGDYEKYTSEDNAFSVVIPKDWHRQEKGHPYGDLTKITGARLTGPKNKDGAAVTMSVLYYGGEDIFKTPDDFIRGMLNHMVRVDHGTQTAVTDVSIAGRQAKKFRIKTF